MKKLQNFYNGVTNGQRIILWSIIPFGLGIILALMTDGEGFPPGVILGLLCCLFLELGRRKSSKNASARGSEHHPE